MLLSEHHIAFYQQLTHAMWGAIDEERFADFAVEFRTDYLQSWRR